MDISVVVPVYGCRAALHELHRRLVESVSTITDDFEIILVNKLPAAEFVGSNRRNL